jgi:hypothetical protein
MPDSLLGNLVFLAVSTALAGYWFLQGRHQLYVRELCHGFNGKVIKTSGSIFGWKVAVLSLWLRQRQVFVEYRFRQIQPRSKSPIPIWLLSSELEIRVPLVQKFWLRLLPQQQDETAADELITGIPELDRKYVIHANQSENAEDFLKRPAVRDRITQFPLVIDRLEIYKGFLKAVINQPFTQRLMREEFEQIVQALLDIVDVYEHQPSETLQLHQTGGEQSCPYCRGMFEATKEVIVECVQCGTVLHQQCWQENGQCTTWGCASVKAQ